MDAHIWDLNARVESLREQLYEISENVHASAEAQSESLHEPILPRHRNMIDNLVIRAESLRRFIDDVQGDIGLLARSQTDFFAIRPLHERPPPVVPSLPLVRRQDASWPLDGTYPRGQPEPLGSRDVSPPPATAQQEEAGGSPSLARSPHVRRVEPPPLPTVRQRETLRRAPLSIPPRGRPDARQDREVPPPPPTAPRPERSWPVPLSTLQQELQGVRISEQDDVPPPLPRRPRRDQVPVSPRTVPAAPQLGPVANDNELDDQNGANALIGLEGITHAQVLIGVDPDELANDEPDEPEPGPEPEPEWYTGDDRSSLDRAALDAEEIADVVEFQRLVVRVEMPIERIRNAQRRNRGRDENNRNEIQIERIENVGRWDGRPEANPLGNLSDHDAQPSNEDSEEDRIRRGLYNAVPKGRVRFDLILWTDVRSIGPPPQNIQTFRKHFKMLYGISVEEVRALIDEQRAIIWLEQSARLRKWLHIYGERSCDLQALVANANEQIEGLVEAHSRCVEYFAEYESCLKSLHRKSMILITEYGFEDP